METRELTGELENNNVRIKALIDLYERVLWEEITTEQNLRVKKTKAEYLRKEILKAATLNDKLIKKLVHMHEH